MKTLAVILGASLFLGGQDDAVKKEIAKFKGTWSAVSLESPDGMKAPDEVVKELKITFSDEQAIARIKDEEKKATYKLDPTQKPPTIDWTDERGKTLKGIYQLEGDTLKICISEKGNRPKEFKTDAATETGLVVLRRDKK